jgi:hypothetical protein
MREGQLDVRLANGIAFVAGVFLKSVEAEELKIIRAELEELRAKVEGSAKQ